MNESDTPNGRRSFPWERTSSRTPPQEKTPRCQFPGCADAADERYRGFCTEEHQLFGTLH